jgi:hypothetical protein
MLNEILLYSGSGIIFIWGIAHLIPTKMIVNGFGPISSDNRKVLAMEIIAEGLTLCFLGVLVILVTGLSDYQSQAAETVYFSTAAMLVVMALLTAVTGARTPVIWYKLCPVVKVLVALLYILGTVL